MDFSLYEELPLFSGDLLVGLSPQPDELPQDFTEEWNLPFSHNADDNKKGLQYKQPKQEVQITIDFNNVSMFDTKVDLLDLIQSEPTQSQHAPSQVGETKLHTTNNTKFETDDLFRVSELLASDLQSLEYVSLSNQNISSDHQLVSDFNGLEYNATVLGDEDICDEVDSILSSNVDLLGATPILSPVSTEDIDRVLQSEPSSPYSVGSVDTSALDDSENNITFENSLPESEYNLVTVDSHYLREELMKPIQDVSPITAVPKLPARSLRPQRQKVRYDPYSSPTSPISSERSSKSRKKEETMPFDSKSRKKQQNKDAALRYRMKKKQEKGTVVEECSILEKKNDELKDKVDSMTREIQYLKDLLSEVYQAKSGFKSQSHLERSK